MPIARNVRTRQVVQSQDLSGARLTENQRSEALLLAERLADNMMKRSRDTWVPGVKEYTV